MFCIEGLKAAGRCARAVCACLCCLICAGPILLIVGLILLVSPNNRQDRVDEYNKAVKQYEAPKGWGGTIGGETVTVQPTSVEVKGNKDGVDDATSTVAFASVSGNHQSVMYQIDTVKSFTRTPRFQREKSSSLYCSKERGCSRGEMEGRCSGTCSGCGCGTSGSCGTCKTTQSLSKYCAVAKKTSSGEYQEDASRHSCFYPFKDSDQEYRDGSSSSATFQLRASDDPFVALQRITKGSMDFGITAKQQRLTGLVLLIIGAILIACICLVGYCAYRLISAALGKKNETAPSGGMQNNDYPPQQQQPYPQAQPYPPPQQQYPEAYPPQQPQQPYPQAQPYPPQQQPCPPPQQYPPPQQPAYGYGQPPPPGQPNYGY